MPFIYEADASELSEIDEETSPPYPFRYESAPAVMLDQSGQEGSRAGLDIAHDWVAHVLRALREFGVRKAYCRYDGGCDEGLAWLEYVEQADGQRLDAKAFAKLLLEQRSVEVEMLDQVFLELWAGPPPRKLETRLDVMISECAVEWASRLLRRGFGTGEHLMYGAFTVDFGTGVITDDPDAAYIPRHFEADGDPA